MPLAHVHVMPRRCRRPRLQLRVWPGPRQRRRPAQSAAQTAPDLHAPLHGKHRSVERDPKPGRIQNLARACAGQLKPAENETPNLGKAVETREKPKAGTCIRHLLSSGDWL
eukprot:257554-Rhodomonas_salina.2